MTILAQTLTTLFIFFLGTLFGSFLSVVVNRSLNNEKGIFFGKSHCPNCHKNLQAKQLIPLFSYLASKGKCLHCHKKISAEYPLIELASGAILLFVFLNWQFASSINSIPSQLFNSVSAELNFVFQAILALTVLMLCYFDLKVKAVPNLFLLIWTILTLFNLQFNNQYLISHFWSLIAVLVFFGGQILLSRKWLGSADLIFSVGVALIFDLQLILVYIAIAYLIGGFYATWLIVAKKANKKSAIAFLPFLGISFLIVLYQGNNLLNWYLNFNLLSLS